MWSAYLFQVSTGRVGPKVEFSDLSWEIDLNTTESISLKLSKSSLPAVDLEHWLSPMWAGLLLFWDGAPIVGGPILNLPSEDKLTISLNCSGIRSVLARRLVIHEQTNWLLLPKDKVTYTGISLGTIAKNVVKLSQEKPGGGLPISFPLPDETEGVNADHDRNYRGFNLQNLSCDDVLTKLSNVTGGPDVMFKPRLLSDNLVTFDMWHGTKDSPRIDQKVMPVWDMTAENGEVTDISITTTGTYTTHRVFSLGSGQDEAQLITVSFDDSMVKDGYPLLESVISTSDSEKRPVVQAHGDANLTTNSRVLKEIQISVRGDGNYPFGSFWPGDECEIYVKGLIGLKDGRHRMRILNMTGDSTANMRLSLQSD